MCLWEHLTCSGEAESEKETEKEGPVRREETRERLVVMSEGCGG